MTDRARIASWGFVILGVFLASAYGQTAPRVQFDVPPIVSAAPLDDSSVAHILPDTRHFEVVMSISTLVNSAQDLPDYQLWCFIQFPNAPVQVVDYAPQTELASPYLGPLQIDRQRESSQRIGLSINGKLETWGNAQANSELSGKQKEQRRMTEAPPMMLLQTSGTVDRGTGVYYKFLPSRQSTLEGARELRLVIEVPAEWQASVARVTCRAETLGEHAVCLGESLFSVVVYELANPTASELARQFSALERQFRAQWHQFARDRLARRSTRTGLDFISALSFPRVPRPLPRWDFVIDALVFSKQDEESTSELLQALPETVRETGLRLQRAAQTLAPSIEMAGERRSSAAN